MATDPSFFTTPTGIAVIAAGGSFVAGLVGASISAWTVRRSHKERLAADEKLAERKFEFDNSLAERKFQLDARSADRKRRQDLAEEVLAGFQEVEAAVRSIRAPMSYSEEAKDRPRADGETEGAAKLRDVYYVSLARFDRNRAVISALLSRRYRMNAWFGADADAAFQKLHEAINTVISSSQLLVRWAGDADKIRQNNLVLWQKMEGDIWWGAVDPDPIAVKIAEAIAEIEAICRPILSEVVA